MEDRLGAGSLTCPTAWQAKSAVRTRSRRQSSRRRWLRTALCQIHIAHFTRVIALIDYAGAHRILDDVDSLYPLAFAVGDLPSVDLDAISHDKARAVSQAIVDEMTFAIHEIEWSRSAAQPVSADEAMLRRSRAVVAEDDALQRLAHVRQLLQAFEADLRGRPWSAYFTHPAPFSSPGRSSRNADS